MTDLHKQATLEEEELERQALFAFLDDGAEQVAATANELADDEKIDLTDLAEDPTTKDRKGLTDYCCEVFEAMCPSYHAVFTRRMLANHSTIQLKHLVALLQEIMDSDVAAERFAAFQSKQEDFQLSPSAEVIKDDQATPANDTDSGSNYALLEGSSGVITLAPGVIDLQGSDDEMMAVEDTANAANVASPPTEYCTSCGQEIPAERSLLGLTLCADCDPDAVDAYGQAQAPLTGSPSALTPGRMTQLGAAETALFPADPDDPEKRRWQDEGGT